MSPFSSTYEAMSDGAAARVGKDHSRSAAKRPAPPVTGPVLMGDIHPAPGGRPLLLSLWAQWEEAARER
ncbi:MAG: hypothetical protein NXH97_15320 [Rhodobacteraceae bacterium]|nr:hypothetical protein [Paracoccaceae bacterium]